MRIPRGLAEAVGLGAGAEVSVSAKDGELVVKPSGPARLSLGDLLAEVSEEKPIPLSIRVQLAVARSFPDCCVYP